MALQKQTVAFPFTSGMQTKVAAMHVEAPQLLDLQNAKITKAGLIQKRTGFTALPATLNSTYTMKGLRVFGDENTLAAICENTFSGISVAEYESDDSHWVSSSGINASAPLARVTHFPVPTSNDQDFGTLSLNDISLTWNDCAYTQNYIMFVWVSGSSGAATDDVYVSIYNTTTESWPMISKAAYTTAQYAKKARCVASSDEFFVVWVNGGDDCYLTHLDTGTTKATEWSSTEVSIVNNITKFDIHELAASPACAFWGAGGNGLFVIAYLTTGGDIYTAIVYNGGVVATSAALTPAAAPNSLCVTAYSSNTVYVHWADGANLRRAVYTYDLTVPSITYSSDAVYSAGFASTPKHIVSTSYCDVGLTSTGPFYDVAGASYDYEINISDATNTPPSSTLRGCGILSDPVMPSAYRYITVQHIDDLQRAILVCAVSATSTVVRSYPIARLLSGYGITPALYSSTGSKYESTFAKISSNKFVTCVPVIRGYRGDLAEPIIGIEAIVLTVLTPLGGPEVFTYTDYLYPRYARHNSVFLFSGAQPKLYDGRTLTDVGFAWYPEELTVSAINHASGALAAGDYSVKAIYVWYDAAGNRYESMPSSSVSVAIAAPNDAIRVIVPTLGSRGLDTNVVVEVYRTAVGGVTFYYAGKANVCIAPASASVTVELYEADNTITDNRMLYTEGGALANDTLQSCSCINSRRDRIFAATGDYEIAYSKTRVDGYGPEFPAEFTISVDRKHGKITALADADGREIIFCERGIFYFDGDGPNDLGQGNFTDIRDIVSPVGAVFGSPAVATSMGVWFVSSRGIELLGRDLSVAFKGAPVQNALTGNITEIVHLQPESEIWFFTDSGDGAIYHEDFDVWSTFTGVNAKNACLYGTETIAIARIGSGTAGQVWVTNSSVYTDNTASYALLIDTAWLALAGKQGWQRVYNVALVGEYKAGHVFTVGVYYDYSETVAETVTLTCSSDPNPEQLIFKPAKQKCQAIRFRITDATPSGTQASFALSHLQLEVGVKGGIARV